jgi:predicted GNAT family acetyltransferase
MSNSVRDNPALNRFELDVDGTVAFIAYTGSPGVLSLDHTEVPDALSGKGVGSALVRGTLELIKGRGERIVPRCKFVAGYIAKHPEYGELVK